ncbi:hypothetical protein ASZ90_003607 [hydrocarbon metagenome]|uniref:Uncharacterized protein n=1 Tax=hydrocarbon metagenome TaxID=938273 RepID=A0A0W8G057_9ZZZZ
MLFFPEYVPTDSGAFGSVGFESSLLHAVKTREINNMVKKSLLSCFNFDSPKLLIIPAV